MPALPLTASIIPSSVHTTRWRPCLQAAGSLVAVRDLQLGCWQGQVELRAAPVALAFAHDSTQLIAVTQVRGAPIAP